jgi:hypothetical protein
MYSSILSLTSTLDEGGWSTPSASRFTRYSLYRTLFGPQCDSTRLRKISRRPGFDPRNFQPVTSRYAAWAISAIACTIGYVITYESCVCDRPISNTEKQMRLFTLPSLYINSWFSCGLSIIYLERENEEPRRYESSSTGRCVPQNLQHSLRRLS